MEQLRTVCKDGNIYFRSPINAPVLHLLESPKIHTAQGVATAPYTHSNCAVLAKFNYAVAHPMSTLYTWPKLKGKHEPWEHQRITAEFLAFTNRGYCLSGMGCVDSETEYLSPTGWAKISQYTSGKVAQYDPATGGATFVEPTEYIKKPCPEMVRLKSTRGLDQLLSPEHRVLLQHRITNETKVVSAESLETCKASSLRDWQIPTAFNVVRKGGIKFSDSMLRVLVAVNADGYFARPHTKWCVVRLKKLHKIERLRRLLNEAGVEYKEAPCLPEGFVIFKFHTPVYTKAYDSWWWDANPKQLKLIVDECQHWDANIQAKSVRFSSTKKCDADFIQYAASATGITASLSVCSRAAPKPTEYCVHIYNRHQKKMLLGTSSEGKKYRNVSRGPSTDGFKYCFSVPSTFLVFRRNGCVFLSGNTGKTGASIWALDYLFTIGAISKVLIVAPLSTLDIVWRTELFDIVPTRRVQIAHGPRSTRQAIIESDQDITIINHDGVSSSTAWLAKAEYDLVILDEATAFKSANNQRWRNALKVIKKASYVWALTGTPAAKAPTDVYGLCKLVTPNTMRESFTSFRNRVMTQAGLHRYIARKDAMQTVYSVLQPAIRFKKEDCVDLPPLMYENREAELTPDQKKAYEAMQKNMRAEMAEQKITALNAAVQLTKLLQICSGGAYPDGMDPLSKDARKHIVQLDCSTRYKVVEEILDSTDRKVLVFGTYRGSNKLLYNYLVKKGYSAALVDGGVPMKKRTPIFDRFQNGTAEDLKVIVAHPGTMSHGLTLTEADTVVWFGPPFSPETYLQANERIYRPGQTRKTTVIHIASTPVEKRRYAILRNQRLDQEALLDLYQLALAPLN